MAGGLRRAASPPPAGGAGDARACSSAGPAICRSSAAIRSMVSSRSAASRAKTSGPSMEEERAGASGGSTGARPAEPSATCAASRGAGVGLPCRPAPRSGTGFGVAVSFAKNLVQSLMPKGRHLATTHSLTRPGTAALVADTTARSGSPGRSVWIPLPISHGGRCGRGPARPGHRVPGSGPRIRSPDQCQGRRSRPCLSGYPARAAATIAVEPAAAVLAPRQRTSVPEHRHRPSSRSSRRPQRPSRQALPDALTGRQPSGVTAP
jgi:hypothetical protein